MKASITHNIHYNSVNNLTHGSYISRRKKDDKPRKSFGQNSGNTAKHDYTDENKGYAHSDAIIKLDEKDKLILAVLNRNASLSYTDIEKETKIPSHVVANRVKRLEKEKIIKAYKLDINYKILGFEEFEVHLRLMGVDDKKTLEIIRDIEKNPNVSWIGTCFGNYDVKVNVFAESNSECYSIINEALKKHRDYIHAEEITSITKKHKTDGTVFLKSILDMKELHIESRPRGEKIEKKGTAKLDQTDITIIKHLGTNARIKLSDLAKASGLTVQGVKNRVKSLYERRIILGSTALIHGPSLGKLWGTCLFKMNLNEEQEQILEKYIYSLSNTSSAVRLIGKWDLGITFFDKNVKALQAQINDFKGLFKDNIKEYDSFIILDIYKYPTLPECIFQVKAE